MFKFISGSFSHSALCFHCFIQKGFHLQGVSVCTYINARSTENKRLLFFLLYSEVQIHCSQRCLLITVISFDNNRKANDVISFHPAVTPQAKWELWKWTSLFLFSLRAFDKLSNSAAKASTQKREECTFSLAIIVFSPKWQDPRTGSL